MHCISLCASISFTYFNHKIGKTFFWGVRFLFFSIPLLLFSEKKKQKKGVRWPARPGPAGPPPNPSPAAPHTLTQHTRTHEGRASLSPAPHECRQEEALPSSRDSPRLPRPNPRRPPPGRRPRRRRPLLPSRAPPSWWPLPRLPRTRPLLSPPSVRLHGRRSHGAGLRPRPEPSGRRPPPSFPLAR